VESSKFNHCKNAGKCPHRYVRTSLEAILVVFAEEAEYPDRRVERENVDRKRYREGDFTSIGFEGEN
jgi:hypothetical protein